MQQLGGFISTINDAHTISSRSATSSSPGSDNICLVGEDSGKIRWIQPSGASCLLPRPYQTEQLAVMFAPASAASEAACTLPAHAAAGCFCNNKLLLIPDPTCSSAA